MTGCGTGTGPPAISRSRTARVCGSSSKRSRYPSRSLCISPGKRVWLADATMVPAHNADNDFALRTSASIPRPTAYAAEQLALSTFLVTSRGIPKRGSAARYHVRLEPISRFLILFMDTFRWHEAPIFIYDSPVLRPGVYQFYLRAANLPCTGIAVQNRLGNVARLLTVLLITIG